jgi:hypothetical protein
MACGYTDKEDLIDIIGDYDIIVDDPQKHVPWAIICNTIDAIKYMKKLKKEKPEINWQNMKLDEWYEQYKGGAG